MPRGWAPSSEHGVVVVTLDDLDRALRRGVQTQSAQDALIEVALHELAERLGEPVGTIKSRMFTGLARLRELLADPRTGETAWKPTSYTT